MKRIIAWFIALVMMFTAIPMQAIVAGVDESRIILENDRDSTSEQEFRQWSYELIKWYRDEYLVLTNDNKFQTDPNYPLTKSDINISINNFQESPKYLDKARHHVYYMAGRAFMLYQGETNWLFDWGNSEWKYADQDPQKLTELYMTILANTLYEKVEADPSYFLNGSSKTKTGQRFNLQTGTMEDDQTMMSIQKTANTNLGQALADTVVSALKAWADYEIAKASILNNAAGDFQAEAKEKLTNQPTIDWKRIWSKVQDIFLKDGVNQIAKTLNEVTATICDNIRAEQSNLIVAAVTTDLANAFMNASDVVIDYLSSTYVTNKDYTSLALNSDYQKAAEKMITALKDKSANTVEAKAKALVKATELKEEDILSEEEIVFAISWNILEHAVEYVLDIVHDSIQEIFESTVPKLLKKMNGIWVDVGEEASALFKDIWNEIYTRAEKVVDETYKAMLKQKDYGKVLDMDILINQINEQFGDEGDRSKGYISIKDFCVQKIVEHLINFVVGEISGANRKKRESDEQKRIDDAKEARKDANRLIDVNSSKYDNKQKKSNLTGSTRFRSQISQKIPKDYDGFSITAGDALKSLLTKDQVKKLISNLVSALMDEWIKSLETELKKNQAVSDILRESIVENMKDLKTLLTQAIESKDGTLELKDFPQIITDVYELIIIGVADAMGVDVDKAEESFLALFGAQTAEINKSKEQSVWISIYDSIMNTFQEPGKLASVVINVLTSFIKSESKTILESLGKKVTEEFSNRAKDAAQTIAQVDTDSKYKPYEGGKAKFNYNAKNQQDNNYALGQQAKAKAEKALNEGVKKYATVQALVSIFDDVWELGGNIENSIDSFFTAATGAGGAEYTGSLLKSCYMISFAHENLLRVYTGASMKNSKGNRYINSIDNGWMFMSAEDVLDPVVCPDVKAIKVITDLILTQINEDIVGMGVGYLTLVDYQQEWSWSNYVKYITKHCPGIILDNKTAGNWYNKMVVDYDRIMNGYQYGKWSKDLF